MVIQSSEESIELMENSDRRKRALRKNEYMKKAKIYFDYIRKLFIDGDIKDNDYKTSLFVAICEILVSIAKQIEHGCYPELTFKARRDAVNRLIGCIDILTTDKMLNKAIIGDYSERDIKYTEFIKDYLDLEIASEELFLKYYNRIIDEIRAYRILLNDIKD